MQDTLMAEPLVLVSLLLVTSFLLWLLADSDDDNSGGGCTCSCLERGRLPACCLLVHNRRLARAGQGTAAAAYLAV